MRSSSDKLRPAVFALLGLLMTAVRAETPPQDASFIMFREFADKIIERALKPETRGEICGHALHGLVSQLAEPARAHDRDFSGMSDDATMQAFETEMRALADMPGQRHTLRELVGTSMQAWCRQHDPYTRFIRPEDRELLQLKDMSASSGVGMSLDEKPGGFFCYPFPGSPAVAAGIKPGDRLLSVDGKPVEDRSLEQIAPMIKGAPGSKVTMRVEHAFGRGQNFTLAREELANETVRVEQKTGGLRLHIRKFTPATPEEARVALVQLTPGRTLTLDLRGNQGGQLEPAIELASLFMEPGEKIVTLRERGKPDDVRTATGPREVHAPAIIILQDEGTASAAEMLIAALLASPANRAASQGAKTYGKGVYQIDYELASGAILKLTTGEMIAPQGRCWEGIGLLPSLGNPDGIFPKE